MTQIPHLYIMGPRSETKEFVGNLKQISSPCLDSLIYIEYVNVIYVTDDTCITDRTEDMLDERLDVYPGSAVLDYPWGDKIYATL